MSKTNYESLLNVLTDVPGFDTHNGPTPDKKYITVCDRRITFAFDHGVLSTIQVSDAHHVTLAPHVFYVAHLEPKDGSLHVRVPGLEEAK